MNQPQKESRRRGIEFIIFLVASAIGIYGLGRGLTGMFEPGQGISLPWLAVTGVAFVILFTQMGRVHDTWPRKPKPQTSEPLAPQPPASTEER